MKPLALTPLILFTLAVFLPACQPDEFGSVGPAMSAQITPPASCGTVDPMNDDPLCNVAIDYPVQSDLTTENSQNIEFALDVTTGTNQI